MKTSPGSSPRPGFAWKAFRGVLHGTFPVVRLGKGALKLIAPYGVATLLLLAVQHSGIAEASISSSTTW